MILTYFNRTKPELNEIKKSIQDTKTEFSKQVELLKEEKTKIMLEIKTSENQIKRSMEIFSDRIGHVRNIVKT